MLRMPNVTPVVIAVLAAELIPAALSDLLPSALRRHQALALALRVLFPAVLC